MSTSSLDVPRRQQHINFSKENASTTFTISLGSRSLLLESVPSSWSAYPSSGTALHLTPECNTGSSSRSFTQCTMWQSPSVMWRHLRSLFACMKSNLRSTSQSLPPTWVSIQLKSFRSASAREYRCLISNGCNTGTNYPGWDCTTPQHTRHPTSETRHRIIATAFYGWQESIGNVTHGDLENMYAILGGRFLSPARVLANEFTKMSRKLTNQAISGGAFIPLLSQGLGVVTDDLMDVGRNTGLTLQSLKNIKVVGVDRHRHFLLEKSGREWMECGPDDVEDLGVEDFTFSETPGAIREILVSRLQAGSSHTPYPPNTNPHHAMTTHTPRRIRSVLPITLMSHNFLPDHIMMM